MSTKHKKLVKWRVTKYLFCNYCGRSISPQNIVWGWTPGPSMYCSDVCKDKLAKKEVPNETSTSSVIG